MTHERFPKHFRIFSDFEDIVQIKYPHEYETFQRYSGDLILMIRRLEVICMRYEDDKKTWIQIFDRVNNYLKNIESLSQNELQEESSILGYSMIKQSSLLELDIDSFYIFARIMLDRLPYLLRPFLRGTVSNQDVNIRDFRKFVDWFKKNPDDVLDVSFNKKIMAFRKWFYDEIRDPRNELIVHPKWNIITSAISQNGGMEKIRYASLKAGEKKTWLQTESINLPDINNLLKKIIDFLRFINIYFSEILS